MKKILLVIAILCSSYFVRSQICSATVLSSGPNAFGTGGGVDTYHQSCLTYNKDLNAVLWIHRSSPSWQFAGYNSGCVQATWMDVTSGVKDSTLVYRDSAATSSNPARYPGGVFYNPSGNTSISNAYVVSSGPDLIGGINFSGVWYASRKLTGTSADQQLPGVDSDFVSSPSPQFGSSIFLNDDMQQVGNKVLVAGELRDTSYSAAPINVIRGGVIGKCDFSSGSPVWSHDSIVPGYYFNGTGAANGYASDGLGGRIAFDPTGTVGYWVQQGRLATNYNNSADSMLSPIVYKTTNGGNTWFPVLQGYDWSAKHPELKKNVGFLYNTNGMNHFKINPKHGYDVTVDSTGTLHLVASMISVYQEGSQPDSLLYSYTYDHDYVSHHPVIWDLMTDGVTWNTLLVDSIITSYVASDPASDTTASYNAWSTAGTYLAYGARIQVSRSVSGGKIFYSWADSDPAVTGTPFNTQPDLYLRSYDVSQQKVTSTVNLTNGIGICFFHYISDVSYFDNSQGKWVCPLVYTTGRVSVSPGVYDGNSAVDYNYVNCGAFTNTQYVYPATVYTASSACSPSVTFVMHQDSANPQPGIWEASAYYSSNVTSAVWYWGDGSSSSGLAPTHTYAAAGQYNICVTVYSACGDSASACQNDSLYRNSSSSTISVTVLNENHVGIKTNVSAADMVSIYPNPSQGAIRLQIQSSVANNAKTEIYITHVLGEVIYTAKEKTINTLNKEIDLGDINNGTYFVRIVMGSKIYNGRFIISK